MIYTPALTRLLLAPLLLGNAGFTEYGLQLDHGSRDVAAVEREINRAVPRHTLLEFHLKSVVEAQAELATKPEAIALGAFGVMAALARLLIAMQAIARQRRADVEDLGVLRALGADPAMTASDGLIGVLGAVVVGSLLAAGVAIGLSPLSPIGPVRQVYPSPGIAFDWTVLGVGLLVLIGAFSVSLAARTAPHRVARQRQTDRAAKLQSRAPRGRLGSVGAGRRRAAVRAPARG